MDNQHITVGVRKTKRLKTEDLRKILKTEDLRKINEEIT